MNIAIILMMSVILFILNAVFGVQINSWTYAWLAVFAIIYGMFASFVSLLISRWTAKRMYKIQLIDETNSHKFDARMQKVFGSVARIAQEQNMPFPEVGIYHHTSPNAFATWPSKKKSLVAVSSGLLDLMNDAEVEWVIAHEMAHIQNGDMVTMTLLQGIINAFVIFLARVIAGAVTAARDEGAGQGVYFIIVIALDLILSLLGSLIFMRFSRWREFRADAGSSQFVGREKMIAALQKLKEYTDKQKMERTMKKERNSLAPAMIAQFEWGALSLFASHPPLEKRIEALHHLNITQ